MPSSKRPDAHRTRSRDPLRALADYVGILPSYNDQAGREQRETSDATRIAILQAMGMNASTPERAAAHLAELRDEARRQLIEPVCVTIAGDASLTSVIVRPGVRGAFSWRVEIETESGQAFASKGMVERGRARMELPTPIAPTLGYHTLRVFIRGLRKERMGEQTLIVCPPRCTLPHELLGDRRAFGVVANLYSVHSDRNWGVGDFADLAALAEWTGSVGGDFVGVNPLHALLNRGSDISPYGPVSRLFRNPLYLDVEAVPELAHMPHVATRIASPELRAELAQLREGARVRYEEVNYLKQAVLEELYHAFVAHVRDSGGERGQAYHTFVRRNDPELTRFATWMAIGEGDAGFDWRAWSDELRDPESPEVMSFAEQNSERIDYHRWLQFECDRQLAEAADTARRAKLAIGLYQDLAIGTSPSGSDAWSFPGLFVDGASIGAPPDPYSATGQNWGLPPLDPRALRRDCYRYFVRLLRAGFRHAGALRIDHAMGLFRLFWIPDGLSGTEGAYVRYPAEDLLGILALESARHRALVVGEDLGTVPEEVPAAFAQWGILSSRVLYFEREENGEFRSAQSYEPLALATANTHDMPTLEGFRLGHDIELRARVGLLHGDSAIRSALMERDRDRALLSGRVGLDPEDAAESSDGTRWREAVHDFLCSTESILVGISLDDLAGEAEPVNLPGVGPDEYPSWTRKMRTELGDALAKATDVCAARKRPPDSTRPETRWPT